MSETTLSSKIYTWALKKASDRRATFWLSGLFFFELILFIPLDTVLVFFCMENRKKIFLYSMLAAIFSTCSGLIGYGIGVGLWDLLGDFIVPKLISVSLFNKISHHFELYEHWAVFFCGLLPFPLKALSITAGVFEIGIFSFVFYLLMGRLVRFFLVASAMILWGEKVKQFVEKHFHHILLAIILKICIVLLFFWVLSK